jgi:hypothetical protein
MRTKFSKLFGILVIVLLIQLACTIDVGDIGGGDFIRGSGTLITNSRSVSNFDHVDLSGSGEVYITQSGEESLTVETDDNVMEYITTEVRGGTLYLGFDSQNFSSISPTRLIFTLNVKDLVGVKISGSGDIFSESIESDRLDIRVSGSGEIRIDSLITDSVDVDISGSGEIDLTGETTVQDISITGSGEYKAGNLKSKTVDLSISGSGDATVWVTESFDAHVGGSGSAKYYGTPSVSFSSSGSGDLHSLGEK